MDDPAQVRDPNRKSTVEHAIGHTQVTALKGRRFDSIEAQNELSQRPDARGFLIDHLRGSRRDWLTADGAVECYSLVCVEPHPATARPAASNMLA